MDKGSCRQCVIACWTTVWSGAVLAGRVGGASARSATGCGHMTEDAAVPDAEIGGKWRLDGLMPQSVRPRQSLVPCRKAPSGGSYAYRGERGQIDPAGYR